MMEKADMINLGLFYAWEVDVSVQQKMDSAFKTDNSVWVSL